MIRLSDQEILDIKNIFKQYFLTEDKLWIFGSRVRANAKGGDIDLYAETGYKDAKTILDKKYKFLVDLQLKIGEQKIDMAIKYDDTDLLIHRIAKEEGVRVI